MTAMNLKSELRQYFAKIGSKGGKKGGKMRMAQLTAQQRSELARQAALKRWAKKKGGL